MPEAPGEVGGGAAQATRRQDQASTALTERAEGEAESLIEQVVCRENMLAAYHRVARNKGAAGVDGMTVDQLWPWCQKHWSTVRNQILEGTYVPKPVRKVEIPKPDGGIRVLGIPTVVDRMIQQALSQVLGPIYDPTFSDASFGFRPGRSAHDAVQAAKGHIAEGYRWVVDMDLEKFFDRVNHDVLMGRLARRIEDKQVLRLIRRYLQAGMMEEGLVSARTEGTPQGGPLSPLLSNILLDELDKELEKRGHRFVRYADDCNVYVKSEAAGERVLESLKRFLDKRLRLKVNDRKSAVDRPWKRKFLGYSVTVHRQPRLRVAPESVARFKKKLKPILRRGRGRSLSRVLEELGPILRGWIAYYKLCETRRVFEDLDGWIARKLRCILWRQWKRPRTRRRQLTSRGLDPDHAAICANNGRGPWWNAGASHMNRAIPLRYLIRLGLVRLSDELKRLANPG